MKKKDDINDYITAYDAAAILSAKRGRPVLPSYISQMAKSKKHHIRVDKKRDRQLYLRADIEECVLR